MMLKEKEKYEPVISYLQIMLQYYIQQIGEMDVEIVVSRERTGADFCKSCFFLPDKHMYTTSFLEFILDLVTKFKGNSKQDLKCFSDMVLWHIRIHNLLLSFILKIYEVQKRIQG
ncbi:unnamed protein product [Lactuca saligna]|uniref:Uncharacterized protein n=1 Tax=Lactuca saligna TaxID=75948 RepID=A0AA36EJ21_LACSI|nr:unnamed protein product [Lactuca saligna]